MANEWPRAATGQPNLVPHLPRPAISQHSQLKH